MRPIGDDATAGDPEPRDPAAALRAAVERLDADLAEVQAWLEALDAQLVEQIEAAVERQRELIAQQIHDGVMQHLIAAHRELIDAAPNRAGATRVHEIVKEATVEVRNDVAMLRAASVEELGLERMLEEAATYAMRHGGFDVHLDVEPAAREVRPELVGAIARELLMNAAWHSGASEVVVRLRRRRRLNPAGVELEVRDDGCGIAAGRREQARAEGHIGLISIERRIEEAGGGLELESSSAGTRVVVRLPA